MAFDLVQQVKARTRSIQLDKSTALLAINASEQPATQPQPSKRTSSLPPDGQDLSDHPSVSNSVPTTIHRYRSMLEVEEPPKLGPLNPISFEELYTGPDQDLSKSESSNTTQNPTMETASEDAKTTNPGYGVDLTSQQP